MKTILILVGTVVFLGAAFFSFNHYLYQQKQAITKSTMATTTLPTITPIEHATMVLDWGGTIFYTDPVGGIEAFSGQRTASIVLVTDIHGDHFSTSTLEAVVSTETTLIVPQAVKDLLPEPLQSRALVLANGQTMSEMDLTITAVPMYNLPETEDSRHVRGRGNGYVIEKGDSRVYIAGDTAGIPEMRALTDIDIAFVPMNLPYTMGVEEAVDAVLAFKPKAVSPYHYRGQDGLSDVARFKELVNSGNPSIEVLLLNWYPEQ